jgi:solute carrier family 39 (zinc transporter), member 1/2/3
MPGAIMMASLFSLFVIEMWLNSKMGGHSHGGAKGFETAMTPEQMAKMAGMNALPQRPNRSTTSSFKADDDIAYEKKMTQRMCQGDMKNLDPNPFGDGNELDLAPSEMPPWFIVFYEQYIRQRLEMMTMIKGMGLPYQETKAAPVVSAEPMFDVEGQTVDPMVYKKMSMNITLLEGGILFHSVFVGMTVSITVEGFVILLVAILFHQMFEGLGLGARIAAVPYPKGSIKPWLLVIAFGTTAPFGQALGLITRNSYDPNSAFGLIIVGVFNAMSVGPSFPH